MAEKLFHNNFTLNNSCQNYRIIVIIIIIIIETKSSLYFKLLLSIYFLSNSTKKTILKNYIWELREIVCFFYIFQINFLVLLFIPLFQLPYQLIQFFCIYKLNIQMTLFKLIVNYCIKETAVLVIYIKLQLPCNDIKSVKMQISKWPVCKCSSQY